MKRRPADGRGVRRQVMGVLLAMVLALLAGCAGPSPQQSERGPALSDLPGAAAAPEVQVESEDCGAQGGLVVTVLEPGGRGIPDADVSVLDTAFFNATDGDGRAHFPRLPPGLYTLRITPTQDWYRVTETDVRVGGQDGSCRTAASVTLRLQEGLLTPPHVHDDAWRDGPVVEVFTQVFDIDCAPRQHMCQGADQPSRSMMPFGGVVPPGTGLLNVTVSWEEPATAPFTMLVRTPTRDHRDMSFSHPGDTVSLPVEPDEPDPAHAVGSAWGWFWGAGDGAWIGPFTITVQAVRGGYDLPMDPPHPDLWRGRTSYRLVEGNASWDATRVYLMEGGYNTPIYGMFDPKPGTTVIPGATQMHVRAWINHSLPHDPEMQLRFWAPDDVDPIYGGGRALTVTTADGVLYEWLLAVHETWYDALYSDESGWAFSLQPVPENQTGFAWDGGATVHIVIDVSRE